MADEQLDSYSLQNVEGLMKLKERGRGCYGSVYELVVNGVPCIGKRLHNILVGRVREVHVSDEERASIVSKFKHECYVLSTLRHPNVVQFMGIHFGPRDEDITLIMESVFMDLEKCIKTYGSTIPLKYKLSIMRDVSYGLSYLHSCSVIHRDLNQGNVLITEALRAKIADLGASKVVDLNDPSGMSTFPGAVGYMPPEAMQSPAIYDTKLDCFSFGQLSLYLLTEKFPTPVDSNITAKDVQEKTIQLAKRRTSLQLLGTTHVMYNVISQCLMDEPSKRPSSRELANTMTSICSFYPLEFKNILDYIKAIEEMKQGSLTENSISEVKPTVELVEQSNDTKNSSTDYLPVTEVENSGRVVSPCLSLPPSLLRSPSPLGFASQDPTSHTPYNHGGHIPTPSSSPHPYGGHTPTPSSSPHPWGHSSLSPTPNGFNSLSPSHQYIGGLTHTTGSTHIQPQSPSISSPSSTSTNPLMSSKASVSSFAYDYVDDSGGRVISDLTQRIDVPFDELAEEEQEKHAFTNDCTQNESTDVPRRSSDFKQRTLTELFNSYDSDEDNYESVTELKHEHAKVTQSLKSTFSSLPQPTNKPPPRRSQDFTGLSLQPNIIPYASFVQSAPSTSQGSCIYGAMSREVAEALCCNTGDYLVRASPTTGGLVLSVRIKDGGCGHLSIHKTVSSKLKSTKTAYFFNDGEIFESLSDLIKDLASTPFEAESKQLIVLKTPITMESRKIWEPRQFIAGGPIVQKRQYNLSSCVIAGNNEEITAKILTTNQAQILWEGYVLCELNHTNVIQMLGVCIEKPICLLLEQCARNTLSDCLSSKRRAMDILLLTKLVSDLAEGMDYLHSKNIIHRSLAARNCVLSSDYSTAKIANLQRSAMVSKDKSTISDYTNFAVGWASPEVLNTAKYSKSSDVWSFGVLMWEIFNYGKEPYNGLSRTQILNMIQSRSLVQLPHHAPIKCIEVFNKCFMHLPEDRPSFTKIRYLLRETETNEDSDYI